MQHISKSELRLYDPLRTVDFRWQRALEVVQSDGRTTAFDDLLTADLVRYLRARRGTDTAHSMARLEQRWPNVLAADQLHEHGGVAVDEVQARLLSGEAPSAVAARIGLTEAAVTTYASIFFDVIGKLEAHDWITLEAVRIGPWGTPEPDEGAIWRCVGWHCPPALDLLIEDCHGRLTSSGDHLLAERIRMLVRFSCTPVDHPSFLELVKKMADDGIARSMEHPTEGLAQALAQLEFLHGVAKGGRAKPSRRRSKSRNKRPVVPEGVSIEDLNRDFETRAAIAKKVTQYGVA